jgi:hypothetical protein
MQHSPFPSAAAAAATLLLLASAAASAAAASPEDAVFTPGVPMLDTRGKRIYAGGANMYLEDGTYYLVGEGEKVYSDCSECLVMYKSTDLQAWDYVGCTLNNSNVVAPLPGTPHYRMERPKIFKCPGTGKHMLWFHCDTPSFAMQSVGVLTAPAVEGPYSFVKPCFKPDGRASYDMGTFVDDSKNGGDGKAYLIRSVQNQFAGISAMNDDCSDVTGIVSQGPDMEGQALMRDTTGALFAMGSHLTGWAPNAMQFVATTSQVLSGAVWVNNTNPTGDATSFGTQSTFIFPFVHADGHTTFVAMLDRWNMGGPNVLPGGLANMTNVWLPMIPPTPSPPSPAPPSAGWPLVLAACDASAPAQQFAFVGGAAVLGSPASGLCVQASGDANNDLALAACAAGAAAQQWAAKGQVVTSGDGRSRWNNANDLVTTGNNLIAYPVQNSWNERFSITASAAAGQLEALDEGGARTGQCVTAVDPSVSSGWRINFLKQWSLKDF